MSNIHLLIKPASSLCNLQCEYCFYCDTASKRDTASFGFMSVGTLENVVKKAFSWASSSVTTVFQGGEPTLVGLPFYKKFVELQHKYAKKGVVIQNSIQTNGVNIDDDFAEFLASNGFLVGVSLDGSTAYHNKYRIDKDGNGSFDKVMAGIAILKKHKVEFNILCVVTKDIANNIAEVYKFYRQNGLHYLQFIPCLQPFGAESELLPYTLTAKEWGQFLIALFDLWHNDVINGRFIYIQQFENYINMLLGNRPDMCGMSGVCSYQNVIEADGSCYPCDFYVLDRYRLGNLNEQNFDDIYAKRKEIQFLEQSLLVNEDCKACDYYGICRGGCKRYCEPFAENGTRAKNILCTGYKEFFAYSFKKFRDMAIAIAEQMNNGGCN